MNSNVSLDQAQTARSGEKMSERVEKRSIDERLDNILNCVHHLMLYVTGSWTEESNVPVPVPGVVPLSNVQSADSMLNPSAKEFVPESVTEKLQSPDTNPCGEPGAVKKASVGQIRCLSCWETLPGRCFWTATNLCRHCVIANEVVLRDKVEENEENKVWDNCLLLLLVSEWNDKTINATSSPEAKNHSWPLCFFLTPFDMGRLRKVSTKHMDMVDRLERIWIKWLPDNDDEQWSDSCSRVEDFEDDAFPE